MVKGRRYDAPTTNYRVSGEETLSQLWTPNVGETELRRSGHKEGERVPVYSFPSPW